MSYPSEPAALTSARADELARIRPEAVLHRDRVPSRLFGRRYREEAFQEALLNAQHRKCCYCEQHIPRSYNDVEHFRPKSRALRGDSFPDHGYWWLAWTWENLMYACPACNRTHKRDRFPLAQGSPVLVPEQDAPGRERPLLINPRREEKPWHHIQYRPLIGRWRPLPRRGSRRGAATIEVLGLARPELVDAYTHHVSHYLNGPIEDIREALALNDGETIRHTWNRAMSRWVRPQQAFTALSYDVFDHHFPRMQRRGWGLELPEPP